MAYAWVSAGEWEPFPSRHATFHVLGASEVPRTPVVNRALHVPTGVWYTWITVGAADRTMKQADPPHPKQEYGDVVVIGSCSL